MADAKAKRFGRARVLLVLTMTIATGLVAAWSAFTHFNAGKTPGDSRSTEKFTRTGEFTHTGDFADEQPAAFRNTQTEVSALRGAIAAAVRDSQRGADHAMLRLLQQTAALLQAQAEQQTRMQAELARLQQRLRTSPDASSGAMNTRQFAAGRQRIPDRQQQVQRLVAAGATASEADALLAFTDELQLQQIEARYRLLRERADGDTQSPDGAASERSRTSFRDLRAPGNARQGNAEQQVRDTFGDAVYDRYLYATDQPNRTRIDRVLPGSSAERAGLKAGDLLLSYDRQTVRSLDDVLRAAARGSDGETATIELLRGNEHISINLPRGPLGIQGQPESINPIRVQN